MRVTYASPFGRVHTVRLYQYRSTDIVDKATRSRMMSTIRGKDTKPEMTVRRYLHGRGMRYRLHDRKLAGVPDIVLPRFKAVVFVHGCFWHRHNGCRYAYSPKARAEFWKRKFDGNVERDERSMRKLRHAGWRTFVVWECELRGSKANQVLSRLHSRIRI